MNADELSIAIDWAAEEGWNPGLGDAICFYNADPNGFFIAESEGEALGCISAVSYGTTFGFIGFYIVKPEYRGGDAGKLLALAAGKYLGSRNIGLDGVLERIENYKRLGFRYAYRNIRFEFNSVIPEMPDGLIPATSIPFQQILEYDKHVFPAEREVFLHLWLKIQDCVSLCSYNNEKLEGWGLMRPCRKGYKIGPLFADNMAIAENILCGMLSKSDSKPVYFDIPERNKDSLKLASKYLMRESFATARMYSHGEPNISIDKVYGVTSFELG